MPGLKDARVSANRTGGRFALPLLERGSPTGARSAGALSGARSADRDR